MRYTVSVEEGAALPSWPRQFLRDTPSWSARRKLWPVYGPVEGQFAAGRGDDAALATLFGQIARRDFTAFAAISVASLR